MIKRSIRIAAGVLMAVMLVTAIIFALGVNSIRIGGAPDLKIQQANRLEADALPSPLFLASAYFEVTELVVQAERKEERIANLGRSQKKSGGPRPPACRGRESGIASALRPGRD